MEKVSFYENRNVNNQSFHECGIDGKRGDGVSKWEDKSSETLVTDESGSTVSIKKRVKDIIVESDCGSTVLLSKKGDKYFGKKLH